MFDEVIPGSNGLMHGLVNCTPTSTQKNELHPFTYKVSLFAKNYAILNNKVCCLTVAAS
jgi:hypothetical protein